MRKVASLTMVSPGAATDGVTLFFPKNDDLLKDPPPPLPPVTPLHSSLCLHLQFHAFYTPVLFSRPWPDNNNIRSVRTATLGNTWLCANSNVFAVKNTRRRISICKCNAYDSESSSAERSDCVQNRHTMKPMLRLSHATTAAAADVSAMWAK